MGRYVLRRLVALVPVWVGISLLAFALGALAPGDPAATLYQHLYDQPPPSQEALERLRQEWGLGDPLPTRYVRWAMAVMGGDLGLSYRTGRPVLVELAQGLGRTLELATFGLVVSVALAFPLGILSAVRHNSAMDSIIRVVSMGIAAMPSYWMAYLLILVFAVWLHLLPVAGSGTWRHLVLPVATVGISGSIGLSRLLRSSMLEALGQDYIRTALSKGLGSSRVVAIHALRNALIPAVTMMGKNFGALLTGSVIAETVFSRPGVGRVVLEAISFRDYPIIQGFVMLSGTLFVLMNLAVDLSYAWIDPRIRLTTE
ncbi:MAG: ABC transporter permease [Anaerolineae bacterium]